MSASAVVLRASGSHLYPGARGSLDGPPPGTRTPCLVEFVDGAAATATLAPGEGGLVLETAPYSTARGRRIPARRWRVALAGAAFRVLGRA